MLFHQHIAIYYRYKYVLIPPTMGVYETTVSCSHRLNKLGLSCAKLSLSWLQAYSASD